jgi:hypothetical protein
MKQEFEIDGNNPLLKLSRVGGWFAFIQALTVIFIVVTYFIWPHVFSDHDVKMIFEGIHSNPFIYFMKLDPFVPVALLFQLPVYIGLWAVLKKTDNAIAIIALLVGVLSIAAILTTRPIIEMFALASQYSSANIAEQHIYISAGESLYTLFHGTAWATSIMLGGITYIMFAMMMRKSSIFRASTSLTLIISGSCALLVLIPTIGIIALFFATFIGIVANILCGIDLLKLQER